MCGIVVVVVLVFVVEVEMGGGDEVEEDGAGGSLEVGFDDAKDDSALAGAVPDEGESMTSRRSSCPRRCR